MSKLRYGAAGAALGAVGGAVKGYYEGREGDRAGSALRGAAGGALLGAGVGTAAGIGRNALSGMKKKPVNPPKVEAPKIEAPKVNPPKVNPPKVDTVGSISPKKDVQAASSLNKPKSNDTWGWSNPKNDDPVGSISPSQDRAFGSTPKPQSAPDKGWEMHSPRKRLKKFTREQKRTIGDTHRKSQIKQDPQAYLNKRKSQLRQDQAKLNDLGTRIDAARNRPKTFL